VMELLPQLQIALRDLPSKLDATAAVAVSTSAYCIERSSQRAQ
jgi:hypothetical protein